ncbi:hypothetical protein STANM309S_01997 [Streptomyces tanashiensis]
MAPRVRMESTSRVSIWMAVPLSCSRRKTNSTKDSESISRFSIRSRSDAMSSRSG